LTVQRRTILEAVLDRDDHPTADQIYEDVRHAVPTISRSTVYRVLDMLVRSSTITRACHPGSAGRFDRNTRQHHHLVCLHCEKVIDLHDERLNALPMPDTRRLGFEIVDYRIQLRGICHDCRRKQRTSSRRSKRGAGGSITAQKKRGRKTQASEPRRKTP